MRFRHHLLLAVAVVASAAPVLAAGGDPADRLARYDDGVVAIMKAGLPTGARVERFTGLVRNYYDMAAVAALVVGPGWAGASAADKAAAITALTRHSAVALARNFKSWNGERFAIDPAVTTRGASRVVKLVIASGSSSNTLLYVMQQGAGGWRIVDILSNGVSQLAVQRADLAATVAGGGAAGLAKRLAEADGKAG